MKRITLLILLASLFALTKAQTPIYDDLQVYGTATFEKDIDVDDSITSPIGHFDTVRFPDGTYQATAGKTKSDSVADTYTAIDSITTAKLIATVGNIDTINNNKIISSVIESDYVEVQATTTTGVSSTVTTGTGLYGYGTASAGIGVYARTGQGKALFIERAGNNNSSESLIDVTDLTGGAGNRTGNIINITDSPTTTGTVSGSILSATVDGTERINFNPRSAATDTAYTIDTDSSLTTGVLLSIKNQGTPIVSITKDSILAELLALKARIAILDTLVLNGTTIDTTYSSSYIMENTEIDKLQFNPTTQAHSEGTLFYDSVEKSMSFYNEFSDFKEEFGRGVNLVFYNNTGSTIFNGTVVRPIGVHKSSSGSIIFDGDLAGNASLDSIIGVAVATHDVLDGEYGIGTALGQVNGLNTSAFSDNDIIFIGHAGEFTNVPPEPPLWYQVLGRVVYADNDSGAVYIKTGTTKYSPTPVFTASFEDSTEIITNTGTDVFEPITSATNSLFAEKRNYGFTFQGDSVSPKQAGTYNIVFSYSFVGTVSQTDLYRIGTFIDGVKGYSTSMTANSTNAGGVPYQYEVYLTAGQWISFKIANTTIDNRDCIFYDGVVTINYEQ